ncbi:MAG: ASPIC/UnbV domain-containing protein [Planctomycetota bacterium]|nr:ASPIC/UnbV domain-containing protein [Planctomycetota bacterium]MDP6763284.1 ASPIC/UnbV domain-containing protein [Planctomycetota bacterium]MDP6988034.1 ASPIC/UnbV domain-containing protein [Planctomycetota bacterium]
MSHSPRGAGDADPRYLAGWYAINSLLRRGFSWSGHERNCALVNDGGERFVDASFVAGLDHEDDGRGTALIDWDWDGDLDLLVTNRTGPRARLLLNEGRSDAGFVAFRLEGRGGNTAAIGARVRLECRGEGGPGRIRTARAGEGFLSQSSRWLHFGLGAAEPSRALVRWPNGTTEGFDSLARDRRYVLVEGSGVAREWAPPSPSSALAPAAFPPGEAGGSRRIVLSAPVGVPTLHMADEAGRPASLLGVPPAGAGGTGAGMWVSVWASWCAPCRSELSEWSAAATSVAGAGLGVAALCADEEATRGEAQAFLDGIEWPFARLFADAAALDVLDVLHGAVLDSEGRLPLPASFLVDGGGRLCVLYLGRVSPERVTADLALLDLDPAERRDAAVPFAGRWFAPPTAAPLAYYAARFRRRGLAEAAREFDLAAMDVSEGSPAEVHVQFGRTMARAGRLEEAAGHFERAIAADPAHFDAHADLGIVRHAQRRFEDAAAAYRAALALDAGHERTWFNLGLVSLAGGDRAAALRASARLVELSSPLTADLERAVLAFDARARERADEGGTDEPDDDP